MHRISPMSKAASGPAFDSGTIQLVSEPDRVEAFQRRIAGDLEKLGYPKASLFAVRLALHEALRNAFQHGHKALPNDTPVQVTFSVDKDRLSISIEDRGPGFDPGSIPDPTLDENLEAASGRGLMLMRAYMSRVHYTKGGRRLEMEYQRPATKTP